VFIFRIIRLLVWIVTINLYHSALLKLLLIVNVVMPST